MSHVSVNVALHSYLWKKYGHISLWTAPKLSVWYWSSVVQNEEKINFEKTQLHENPENKTPKKSRG
jgi:hypothetical protein